MNLVLAISLAATQSALAVIGGAPAPELERHTVMVLSKKGSQCSGVLIAPKSVLTAAHCVSDHSDYAVFIRNQAGEPVLLAPHRILVHPNYVADAIQKRVRSIDLAVVLLKDALPPEFLPVALSAAIPRAGDVVTVGGYGLQNENQKNSTGKFFSVDLTVTEPYGPSAILLWLKSASTADQRGGCHGDSGGPLFYGHDLVAITTWTTGIKGRECGALTQGALIAPQRQWIENAIR